MTEKLTLDVSELSKIVRDEIRKEMAGPMVDSLEAAKEVGEKTIRDEGVAKLVENARTAGTQKRAKKLADGTVSDPHKGKGIAFTRFVRTLAIAKDSNSTPELVARGLARDFPEYAEVADMPEIRALSQGSFTGAGALIPTELASEFIELLYAATVTLSMGMRTMNFAGSISMGRLNSGATVGYVGEGQNTVPTAQGVGELRMTGKKALAVVALTNELLRNPRVGVDAIVRDDLLKALALRRDLSVLRGSGDAFQPKGLVNAVNSSNVFASAGTTTQNKVADIVKMIRLVDESNVPLDSGGFVMSPRSKWSLFSTLDANSNFVFAAMLATGNLLGFQAKTTTQVPNNLGGGSDSEVHFGAWSDLIMGFDDVTPMQVLMAENAAFYDGSAVVSGFSSDQTPIRIMEGHDVLLRHDNTFSRMTGVQWV